jgi:hypothetical protein
MAARTGIFISYRREDTRHLAGRLYDQLSDRFGRVRIFMDVDSIAPGSDFALAIDAALESCAVAIALIGKDWLTIVDEEGFPRIKSSDDFVRRELEAALLQEIPIIPVLADGAAMPGDASLPRSIAALSRRQALHLTHSNFRAETEGLISGVTSILNATRSARQLPSDGAAAPRTDVRPHDIPGARGAEAGIAGPGLAQGPDPGPKALSRTLQIRRWSAFGWVREVAFSPSGALLASCSGDEMVRLWQASTGKRVHSRVSDRYAVNTMAFSPDNVVIATGCANQGILWDLTTGKRIRTLVGHTSYVGAVAFSPNGTRLATGSGDMTARVWNTTNGELERMVYGHRDDVWSVAFNPDGALLATGSGHEADMTVRLWDPITGDLIHTLSGYNGAVAFSPDGSLLATGCWDKVVRLWDPTSGVLLDTLVGHTAPVGAVAFSSDGAFLASGSWDKKVRLWHPGTGESIRVLSAHRATVTAVAFSPDGTLATGSLDKTVRLWS